jgi:uncharacterized protein YndB with AHSA1/START domain
MSTRNETAAETTDHEIIFTRLIDGAPQRVWEAWTDPKQLVQWWGPNGFRTTMQEMDVRSGGNWRFIMHGPDGKDYPNKSTFVEIVKPSRIVYDHRSSPHFRATATFEPQGEKTKLTVRMRFDTPAELQKTIEVFGAVEGGKQTWGRLAEYVETMG